MKRVFATAFVTLAGVASAAPEETAAPPSDGSAPAATAPAAADEAATAPAAAEPSVPKPEGDAEERPRDAAEVFVPSEAISEDIAVPFPVDI